VVALVAMTELGDATGPKLGRCIAMPKLWSDVAKKDAGCRSPGIGATSTGTVSEENNE
jgi:hypothetical protein